MKKLLLYFLFVFLTIISCCTSKTDSAKESLVGTWQVTEIFKNIPATGLSEEDKSGSGVFEFTSTQCDYNFTFGMEVEMNSFGYEFQTSKENAGFTKDDCIDHYSYIHHLSCSNYSCIGAKVHNLYKLIKKEKDDKVLGLPLTITIPYTPQK